MFTFQYIFCTFAYFLPHKVDDKHFLISYYFTQIYDYFCQQHKLCSSYKIWQCNIKRNFHDNNVFQTYTSFWHFVFFNIVSITFVCNLSFTNCLLYWTNATTYCFFNNTSICVFCVFQFITWINMIPLLIFQDISIHDTILIQNCLYMRLDVIALSTHLFKNLWIFHIFWIFCIWICYLVHDTLVLVSCLLSSSPTFWCLPLSLYICILSCVSFYCFIMSFFLFFTIIQLFSCFFHLSWSLHPFSTQSTHLKILIPVLIGKIILISFVKGSLLFA